MSGIEGFIANYGLIAVFLGCFIEGETAAIAGGVMAHHGLVPLWQVAVTAAFGAFCADFGIFLYARRHQESTWLLRQMSRPIVARTMARVNANPHSLASVFRFIPGMRIVGPMVLAQSKILTLRFAAHAAVSAVIWAVFYAVFGVAVGEILARVLGSMSGASHVLIAAVIVLIVAGGLGLWHWRQKRAP
ncbi:membrane protein DedA, SNARE-associated domain [Sulfitobacter brevis]|uniref:Membrane protein DedA, SNARE-associated domain n=1 Tax=Sulfitobacter brevis TaxID=74348 RepID=A0A1I1UBI8_9RHOB|nr:DedA family protein [Sulfitobacter brevis]SFD68226.1 membrane protein DedA, SNARE-associated domain [Sulfitobacter brevis]